MILIKNGRVNLTVVMGKKEAIESSEKLHTMGPHGELTQPAHAGWREWGEGVALHWAH